MGGNMKKAVVSRAAAAARKPNYKRDRRARIPKGDGGTEMIGLSTQSGKDGRSDSLGLEPEPDVANGTNSSMEAMIMGSIDLSVIRSTHAQSADDRIESRVKFKDDVDLPAY